MRRERTCKGCDGTGCERADDHFGAGVDHECSRCPACGGAGVVEDHIPAADAVADAETLRAAFWDEGGGAEWTDAPRGMLVNALRASDYGEASIAETCPAGRIQVVYAHAAAAARAAFRAVPGLRD